MRAILPVFAVFAAALLATGAAPGPGTEDYTKVANQLVELIRAGDYAGIQATFNKGMDAALPLQKSSAFFNGLARQMGQIQKLGEPQAVSGAMVFPATFEKGTLDLQLTLDSRGLIAGLLFKPHAATRPAPEKRQTPLSLTTKVANRLVELINAGDYAGIQATFNKEMDAALPLEKSSPFFNGLTQQMGKIQKLGEPRPVGEAMVFPVRFEKGTFDMELTLDSRGLIAGVLFKPPVATEPAPEKQQTPLSLPFKGRWLVFWGGDTRELNQHHDVPNQRFAFDLLGVGEGGKTQQGDRTRNEDYYAFGREVLAPADGTVIEVIEGVRDNRPGSLNPYSAVGNCVVIRHREDEVSVLAHFKQGSIVVKAGDKVKRGQLLGQCGNSGNSSEPHIHYQLQNSPVLQDGLGIKCVFQKVVVTQDGKTETRTEFSPVKGEIISPE